MGCNSRGIVEVAKPKAACTRSISTSSPKAYSSNFLTRALLNDADCCCPSGGVLGFQSIRSGESSIFTTFKEDQIRLIDEGT